MRGKPTEVMMTLSAGAADQARARLVGQRSVENGAQAPILVCQYRTAAARYEVVAAKASCAPYLALEESAGARERPVTVARASAAQD
jgi:hypothetical protein